MTNLDTATIEELIEELARRSTLASIYVEYNDEEGRQNEFWGQGDAMRMIGLYQAILMPFCAAHSHGKHETFGFKSK